jgi:hypothetical protein
MGPGRAQNRPNERATGDPEDAFKETWNVWKKGKLSKGADESML